MNQALHPFCRRKHQLRRIFLEKRRSFFKLSRTKFSSCRKKTSHTSQNVVYKQGNSTEKQRTHHKFHRKTPNPNQQQRGYLRKHSTHFILRVKNSHELCIVFLKINQDAVQHSPLFIKDFTRTSSKNATKQLFLVRAVAHLQENS